MLNSILNRFGYTLVRTSQLPGEPRDAVLAFAYDMEMDLACSEDEGDSPLDECRFHMFDALYTLTDVLADLIYTDEPEEDQREYIRNQAAAVGVAAMAISAAYGDLLGPE